MRLTLSSRAEAWPLAQPFVISRGAKTEAVVVVAEASDGSATGRGECVPYGRYGETVESVLGQMEACRLALDAAIGAGADTIASARWELQAILPPGAARNAIDCALWDLEARVKGTPVAQLAGIALSADPVETCYTLSLGTPEAMAARAAEAWRYRLLKLKLGGSGDDARMRAVRASRPDARIVADANEAWSVDMLGPFLAAARDAGIELIEQPLPAGDDGALAGRPRGVPVCADESLHTRKDLPRLAALYDAINVKLDKAGGLTEALLLTREAQALGLDIMTGCMVATSLAMAPALLLAPVSRWVDLDGPLLLARDREPGLTITDGLIAPLPRALWG